MGHPFRLPPLSSGDPEYPPKTGEADPMVERQAATVDPAEEIKRIRAAAEAAGHEEGLRLGRAEGIEAVRVSLAEAVARLNAERDRMEREVTDGQRAIARAVVETGMRLAEAMLGGVARFDRTVLLARIASEATAEAEEGAGLSIVCRACPGTLAEIGSALPPSIIGQEDASMEPGGFVLETRRGEGGGVLDRWDASIERIRRMLGNIWADD